MSFFSFIKRSMGFSGDDAEEEDTLYADTTPDTDDARQEKTSPAPAPAPEPVRFDPDMRARIFDKVLEVFNSALPDFLARSVDPAAQRELLLAALDSDTRAYLDGLAKASEAVCRHEWEERQGALAAELETVRRKSADIEKQNADARQKQLSADRQKRALADRVHDLESAIGKLEAEREQFELENRSLVNRLKVANVQHDDLETSRNEIEALRLELQRLRENPAEASAREIEALKTQIDQMAEGIDSLKEQLRVSSEMLADQRKRAAEAEDAARKSEEALAAARGETAAVQAKLDETNSLLDGFTELSHRLEEVDRALSARETKLKQQKKLLASRDAEIESLRQTISENMRLQAEREKSLRDEIAALRGTTAAGKAADIGDTASTSETAAEYSAPRISEDDLSDIEKTFESEEWFTKTPPPATPSMRSPEAEAEFGYHPPKRRSSPASNPDQLSLF